jgi:hypothetical protein
MIRDPEKRRAAKRRHYEANKDVYKKRAAAHSGRQRVRLRELIAAAKHVPCADCGGTFPAVCMDFDHVGGDKDRNVADMVRRAVSSARLLAEIAKCEVVCSNCHRIRTFSPT